MSDGSCTKPNNPPLIVSDVNAVGPGPGPSIRTLVDPHNNNMFGPSSHTNIAVGKTTTNAFKVIALDYHHEATLGSDASK